MSGFVSVPIIPTFKGMSREFTARLIKPAKDAGKKAGQELSKGLGSEVDSLERQVGASTKKLNDLAHEYEKAYSKQEEMQRNVKAATLELTAAEEKYTDALAKGKTGTAELAKVERAKGKLEKANRDLAQSEINTRVVEEKHARQLKDLKETSERYENAQKTLADQVGLTRDELKRMGGSFSELDQAMDNAVERSSGFGQKLVDGFKTMGKGALLGVGAKAGTAVMSGVHSAIEGGMARLQNVEQAQKMLEGLGHSAGTIDTIMDNAMQSVKGTAFGFGEAASMAATFVGAGVKEGDDLQRVLSLVGDSAAIAGADFQEMGSIWTKIASNQKLSTEELNQLMDRGLGILPKLQEKYGVTTEEARKMISEGKVGFEDFADVMEGMVGGSAQSMGETFSGSAANARAALSRLGEKLQEPLFQAAPAIFAAIGQAIDDLGVVLQPVIEKLAEWLAPKLDALATDVIPRLVDALVDTTERVKEMADWVMRNKDWLEAFGIAAGIAAVGLGAIALQQKIVAAGGFITWVMKAVKATKIWAGVQTALNFVMKANTIALVVTAIAALVAGLVYFFSQTETGRKLWAQFTEALSTKWQQFTDAVVGAWQDHIKPMWDAMVSFVTETLWPAIIDGVQWVGDKWQWLCDTVSAIISEMVDGWHGFSDAIMAVATWIYDNAITGMVDGFQWLWDKIMEILGWISDKWDWLTGKLGDGWDWLKTTVFDAFGAALDNLQTWFQIAVDGITKIWDGLREAAAAPIRFVVNTVWNNGILKAIEGVTKFIPGIEAPAPVQLAFATGGIMPGYTPGRDIHRFVSPTGGILDLSGGEPVLRPEVGRVLGKRWVDGINSAARRGGVSGVEHFLGADKPLDRAQDRIKMAHGFGDFLPYQAHARGGTIDAMSAIVKGKYPNIILTSSLRPGGPYHGTGQATDWATAGAFGNSAEQLALAHDIAKTYPNATELIYDHPGWRGNLKNGRPMGAFGEGYTLAQAGPHHHHVHWAMTTNPTMPFDDGVFMEGAPIGDGATGGFGGWAASQIRKVWDGIMNPIKEKIPEFPGWFGQLPKTFFDKATGAVWEKISSLIPGISGGDSTAGAYTGPVGSGVEQWRPLVEKILTDKGLSTALTDTVLRRMNQESGGNPGAQNNWDINAKNGVPSKGLMQVIGPTFQANKDPGFNDIWDPEANIRASMNYAIRRYGSLPAAYNRAGGYAEGGLIDLAKTMGALLFDRGGLWPSGQMGINLTGGHEWVLPGNSAKEISAILAAVKAGNPDQLRDAMSQAVQPMVEKLTKIADPSTYEGITARGLATEFGNIADMLGMGHTSTVVSTLVKAENDLLGARQAHAERLATITEKEEALTKAREALAELQSSEGGLTKEQQRKVDDANKTLEKAKAEQAAADSDEKRAKAADKVKDAEEKLARIREDIDDKSAENAKKRAEDIEKANAEVSKAESELAAARKASVKALDMRVYDVFPQIFDGLGAAASGVQNVAGQAMAMGGLAAQAAPALGSVASALSGAAAMAGPAGISLSVGIQAVKSGIEVGKMIVNLVKDIIDWVQKARLAAMQGLADAFGTIAEYARLLNEMQTGVAELQQAVVRGLNEQRTAEFNLRVAANSRRIAEVEGALAVAQARQALDDEIEKGARSAQLRMMGLVEDWDTYRALEQQTTGKVLTEWSDKAISALFTYESARAKALQGELTARLEQIKAEDALAAATRLNARNQADLIKAQERLIRMSAKVAGVDLVEATGMEQATKLMVQMVELQNAMAKNSLGRSGQALGIENSYTRALAGEQAQYAGLEHALKAVLAESGVAISQKRLEELLKITARAARRGLDPKSVLMAEMPDFAAAQAKLLEDKALKPIWEAQDKLTADERTVQDFKAEIALFEKTAPLETRLKGLENTIASLDASANAFAEGNEKVRGEYLAVARENQAAAESHGVSWQLDPRYATPAVRDQIAREVHIYTDGTRVYTADDVDKVVEEALEDTGTTVVKHRTASEVAKSRRNGGL